MSFSRIFLFSALILVTLQVEYDKNEVQPLITVTDQMFDSYVKPSDTGRWFIFFYSEKCQTCKETYSKWKQLAKAHYGNFNIGIIDW